MALFRNLEKPKGFTRKPIYWDPEKEEREERERRIREELGLSDAEKENLSTYKPRIKGQFRSAAHGDRAALKAERKKNMRRMFMTIAVLLVLLYFVFTALPFLEQFLEKFAE
ncbi:MAG: hypothetical protein CSB01_04115 [Bacteroidia bacterium]|nr:MAG: hypothetical protein CSB01_04115 [Bacteroidia bacterium]